MASERADGGSDGGDSGRATGRRMVSRGMLVLQMQVERYV